MYNTSTAVVAPKFNGHHVRIAKRPDVRGFPPRPSSMPKNAPVMAAGMFPRSMTDDPSFIPLCRHQSTIYSITDAARAHGVLPFAFSPFDGMDNGVTGKIDFAVCICSVGVNFEIDDCLSRILGAGHKIPINSHG